MYTDNYIWMDRITHRDATSVLISHFTALTMFPSSSSITSCFGRLILGVNISNAVVCLLVLSTLVEKDDTL